MKRNRTRLPDEVIQRMQSASQNTPAGSSAAIKRRLQDAQQARQGPAPSAAPGGTSPAQLKQAIDAKKLKDRATSSLPPEVLEGWKKKVKAL